MTAQRVAVLGRRASAVLAGASAALHAMSLAHVTNIVAVLMMVVMVVACVYCARDLWIRGSLRVWALVALMSLAMIALHIPTQAYHSPAMLLATTLAAVEVVAAAGVVVSYRVRARRLGEKALR